MASNILEAYGLPHPAPHSGAVGIGTLFAVLLTGPVAWSIELLANYALASHACFPRAFPHEAAIEGWSWTWAATLAINLVALIATCVATVFAVRIWRRTRAEV